MRAKSRLRPVESTSKSGCRPRSHGACASVSSASRNPFPSTRSIFARTLRAFHAQLVGAFVEQTIKRGTRRVVGISRHGRTGERLKRKIDLFVRVEGERDARLVLANRRGAFLQTQFPQHGHNRRNERLADDQVGPAAIVEKGHVHAFHREQRSERRARRAAADDANRSN